MQETNRKGYVLMASPQIVHLAHTQLYGPLFRHTIRNNFSYNLKTRKLK